MTWRASLCIRHSADGQCPACKEEIHIGSVYLAFTRDGKDWYNFHPECFASLMLEVEQAVQAFEESFRKAPEPEERGIRT